MHLGLTSKLGYLSFKNVINCRSRVLYPGPRFPSSTAWSLMLKSTLMDQSINQSINQHYRMKSYKTPIFVKLLKYVELK